MTFACEASEFGVVKVRVCVAFMLLGLGRILMVVGRGWRVD